MRDQKLPRALRPRRKRRSTLRFIPFLAVVVFSVISFIATALGMHGLLISLGKVSEVLSLGIALSFTLALQLFLVWAVRLVKISPHLAARVWWLAVYAACLFISVGFAYAFWFHAIAADGYSKQTYQTQAREILYDLQAFQQEYDRLAFSLFDLTAYSEETARIEIDRGGTCGDNSPPTRGPRARLRERDARFFAQMAPHFTAQQEGIRTVIGEVGGSLVTFDPDSLETYQRIANRALLEARGLRNDPQLRSLTTWLSNRLEQGRTAFTDPSGEVFTCPDPYLEEQGRLLLATDLREVPRDFVWFDPRERQESVKLAFTRLLNLFRMNVGSGEPPAASAGALWGQAGSVLERAAGGSPLIQDVLPLVFGLITDLLIFLAAMAAPWRGDTFRESLDALARAQSERPTLGRDFFERLESFLDPGSIPESYRLLQTHAVTHEGRDLVYVPDPQRRPEDAQLRTLMEFLVSVRVAELFGPTLNPDKAPKELLRVLDANAIPSLEVRVYRLRPGFLQELAGELFASRIFVPRVAPRKEAGVAEP